MPDFSQNPRPWIIRLLFIALAAVLIIRLFSLQVVEDKYKLLADDQSIIKKVIYPARGVILDRNAQPLLVNKISYDLIATPTKIKDIDTAYFCSLVQIDQKEFNRRIQRIINKSGYNKPGVFESAISAATNARLQENLYQFNGFELVERSTRTYPLGIAAHVLGYLNEISGKMLQSERYASYRQGDYVGLSGLESHYEEVLRGQRGVEYLVRDVKNRTRERYKNGAWDTLAIAGKDIELHLDADLQAYGEKLMQGKIGSVVAIDPSTGGILAMVSAPSYDPNLLTPGSFSANFSQLHLDYTRPLFNKATQAQYPPGSTFKPITAVIALDVGAITPKFGLGCGGGYTACGTLIRCTHAGGGHAANLRLAMANSCNSYFCHIFRLIIDNKKFKNTKAGLQQWTEYMRAFGCGHPLGIDIPGEYAGNVPDSAYFNRVYNNRWNSCNMAMIGMGQGEITMTPIQLANAMCLIANKGYYYIPHFVKSIQGNENDSILAPYRKKQIPIHIPDSFFTPVIQGMEDVVRSGTGKVAYMPGISVCAKTGTAENYARINGQKTKLDNHSVFVSFAPKDTPKIAIAVIVQNSGYGATWAGPIASLMTEKYLTQKISRPALEERMLKGNTIKKYIRVIDSLQRENDKLRDLIRTADKRTQDSIKKKRDTMLIDRVLEDYFKLTPPPTTNLINVYKD